MNSSEQAIGISFTYDNEDDHFALRQEWRMDNDGSDYYCRFSDARIAHEILEDIRALEAQIVRSEYTDEQAAQELITMAPLADRISCDGLDDSLYYEYFEYYDDKYKRYQWEKKVFPC